MSIQFTNFISFEGIDFSGKSTQIKFLIDRLQTYDIHPVLLREPGGTAISEKIRDILLSPNHTEMVRETEILLYQAARAQLVHQEIIPLLQEGRYVIADRFFDSTTAYQGFGRNLPFDFVDQLNRFATSDLRPFRTFFIDISPPEAEKRWLSEGRDQDRLESGGREFFQRIRDGFMTIGEREPERFIQIDGERSPQQIAEDIWKEIKLIWSITE